MSSRTLNRIVLWLVVASIALGLVAHAIGQERAGDILWAACTALALIPLTMVVVRTLLGGKIGVDIIALLAMAGALLLGEYLAGAVIALMLSGGQALEDFADGLARRELSALLSRAPQVVHRYEGDALTSPPLDDVRPGDLLLVKPGEVVPVDGVVVESTAVLDESALTGEAAPVARNHGEKVSSGTINAARTGFRMRATGTAAHSTYSGIVRLVEQAQAGKAPLVRLADRYAMIFLPVTLAAVGLTWWLTGNPVRALAVLVVATPCPLILAAPVAIVSGISRAARQGVIIKGGGALETLARGRILILDKTGTVTQGAPTLTHIEPFENHLADDLLRMAASLDQMSPHVLAGPILKAAGERNLDLTFPEDVKEELGAGIRGRVQGREIALGKSEWVLPGSSALPFVHRIRSQSLMEGTSAVFMTVDGALAGALILEDLVRPDAPITLRALRRAGFKRIFMLTGDHFDVAKLVGGLLGVDKAFAERSPEEKVEAVREARKSGVTVMVGDGINDAAALATADVGIAMGARGATACSEAADVVLLADRLDRVTEAVRVARRSRAIALQSIIAGMGLSVVAMGVASAGYLPPVGGAVLQEVIDVLVILNALRALRGSAEGPVTAPGVAALGQKYRDEHRQLLPGVKRIRHLADRLDALAAPEAMAELRAVNTFLVEQLLPHDAAEDATVYPEVAKLIGGQDPTATMTRAHLEIEHLVNVFGRLLEGLPESGPLPEDHRELRRVLYGLDAVLKLHFAQEEESYLALLEERLPGKPAMVAGK